MSRRYLYASQDFENGFRSIREELHVPPSFPDQVLVEAEQATDTASPNRHDARDLPFIAIDPVGAVDLDQAFYATSSEGSYTVFYAIADVGAFVEPGGAVDNEARHRGVTLYSPDCKTPLHPSILSENIASLLPGKETPALLWTIKLDSDGAPIDWNLKRALVKVRDAISYQQAQQHIDRANHDTTNPLVLLSKIGELRKQQEQQRGGLSIQLPSQEIIRTEDQYRLGFETSLPVEGWNAQISLLTGIVAAKTMVSTGKGILRTLPFPKAEDEKTMRLVAEALHLSWEADVSFASFLHRTTAETAQKRAFLVQATRSFRGAGYKPFTSPSALSEEYAHGAIASEYAHVTAPLRRLIDRFANEILLAIFSDKEIPEWVLESLETLPSLMVKAGQKDSSLERAMLDFCEVLILQDSVGDVFTAQVVDRKERKGSVRSLLQIAEPAIVADIDVDLPLGQTVSVRLKSVSRQSRKLEFTVV